MKDQFYLHFPTMPKGTAQQKGFNRKTGRYFQKAKLVSAEQEFRVALLPYKPTTPSDKPISLTIHFYFDTKDKKKWGLPKATRPDTDNYLKLFKDCMSADKEGKNGFWLDDAQVWDEHVIKTYAEKATIMVCYEETDTKDILNGIKAVDKAIKKTKKEGV